MSEFAGTVKWYDPTKAFGFISVKDAAEDVFIHKSGLDAEVAELIEGQEVAFLKRQGNRGPEAYGVRVTKQTTSPPRSRGNGFRDRDYGDRNGGFRNNDRGGQRSVGKAAPRDLPSGPVRATVVSKNRENKFMFVRAEKDGYDIFVHGSIFRPYAYQIDRGDAVEVTIEPSERGPRALSLEVL